jgi:hypothetical protein
MFVSDNGELGSRLLKVGISCLSFSSIPYNFYSRVCSTCSPILGFWHVWLDSMLIEFNPA